MPQIDDAQHLGTLPTNVGNHIKLSVTQDILSQKQALHKIHKQRNGLKRTLS